MAHLILICTFNRCRVRIKGLFSDWYELNCRILSLMKYEYVSFVNSLVNELETLCFVPL